MLLQLICLLFRNSLQNYCFFLNYANFLYISKKSSTFAPDYKLGVQGG